MPYDPCLLKNVLVFSFMRERQWYREEDVSLGIEQHDLGKTFDLMAANTEMLTSNILVKRYIDFHDLSFYDEVP